MPLGGLSEQFSQSKGRLENVRSDMPITIKKVMTQRDDSASLMQNSIYKEQFSCYWFHLFIYGTGRNSCRRQKLIYKDNASKMVQKKALLKRGSIFFYQKKNLILSYKWKGKEKKRKNQKPPYINISMQEKWHIPYPTFNTAKLHCQDIKRYLT